jgi:predicted nucleic-acid-binding protein
VLTWPGVQRDVVARVLERRLVYVADEDLTRSAVDRYQKGENYIGEEWREGSG